MKARGRISEASPGRGGSANRGAGANTSTDLLVCFPSRAHLVLVRKPICSPAWPVGHLSRGHGSPLFPIKQQPSSRHTGDHKVADVAEPTSPKVTCAGQIKTKPKCRDRAGSRNRQSVMEEMEKIHAGRRRDSWLKRVCMRLDGRGLQGLFHGSSEEQLDASGTIFSKWLMILHESDVGKEAMVRRNEGRDHSDHHHNIEIMEPSVPPKNALLLMRCRRSSTSPKQSLL